MTYPQVWSNASVRALPVGHLGERALLNVFLARRVFFRAGPWVPLEEEESRLLRVVTRRDLARTGAEERVRGPAVDELLFAASPFARTAEANPSVRATDRPPRAPGARPLVHAGHPPATDADDEPPSTARVPSGGSALNPARRRP